MSIGKLFDSFGTLLFFCKMSILNFWLDMADGTHMFVSTLSLNSNKLQQSFLPTRNKRNREGKMGKNAYKQKEANFFQGKKSIHNTKNLREFQDLEGT